MNYHNIQTDDMLNGEGLRVTLFVSGCENYCVNCQNKQTWEFGSGIEFDGKALKEILDKLQPEYITGFTISGGDPLHKNNINEVMKICGLVRENFGRTKDIWIYTGYKFEDIKDKIYPQFVDVIVDGKFDEEKSDISYPYAGSTNQRIINVRASILMDKIILKYVDKK